MNSSRMGSATEQRTRVVAVVGNPKVASRTASVAVRVAERAAARAGILDASVEVIEVAELAGELFDWASPAVRAKVEQLAGADLAVIASPVYKAAYTGLLKSFLDWFGTTGLDGVIAVPVMVGAGAAHALAVEHQLRPVLIEIGATLPTRGLYVLEQQLDALDAVIDAWLEHAGGPLARQLGGS